MDGYIRSDNMSFLILEDFSLFEKGSQNSHFANWQRPWMRKKEALNTIGLEIDGFESELKLIETNGDTNLILLKKNLISLLSREHILDNSEEDRTLCGVEILIDVKDSLNLEMSCNTLPFLMKWATEILRILNEANKRAIAVLTSQGMYNNKNMMARGASLQSVKRNRKVRDVGGSGAADFQRHQTCGEIKLNIPDLYIILQAESGLGRGSKRKIPYIAIYNRYVPVTILPEVDGAILLPEDGRAIILPEVGGAKCISELHLMW